MQLAIHKILCSSLHCIAFLLGNSCPIRNIFPRISCILVWPMSLVLTNGMQTEVMCVTSMPWFKKQLWLLHNFSFFLPAGRMQMTRPKGIAKLLNNCVGKCHMPARILCLGLLHEQEMCFYCIKPLKVGDLFVTAASLTLIITVLQCVCVQI